MAKQDQVTSPVVITVPGYIFNLIWLNKHNLG